MDATAIDDQDTGRASDAPEDTGQPSCVAVIPEPRPPCVVCGRAGTRRRRRLACITCVRKFKDTGNPLPPEARPSRPGPARGSLPPAPPRDPLLWLLDRMTAAQRDKALAYLGELAARGPTPEPDE
jgi:hypothetical protein